MKENWITHPTVLTGRIVDLEPLEEKHFDELHTAASDKRIWEFYPGDWSVREKFIQVYKSSLMQRDAGAEYPFVVKHKQTNKIIGSTRLLDIVRYDKRMEIGGTWYTPAHWATAVNVDCKLALLSFCFEVLGAHRVQLKTQHNNKRSWKAIEKIGGVYEGIIREHMLRDDGTFRSSAYFSILRQEWSTAKIRLQEVLENKLNAS